MLPLATVRAHPIVTTSDADMTIAETRTMAQRTTHSARMSDVPGHLVVFGAQALAETAEVSFAEQPGLSYLPLVATAQERLV